MSKDEKLVPKITLSREEYEQIDREIEQFRIKADDPRVEHYKKDMILPGNGLMAPGVRKGFDVTGSLLKEDELKWFELRKVIKIYAGEFSVIIDANGDCPYKTLDKKLQLYHYYKQLDKVGKLKIPKAKIEADDIPF